MNPREIHPPLDKEQRYQLGFRLAAIRGSGDGIDGMSDTELLAALRHEDAPKDGAEYVAAYTRKVDAMAKEHHEREEAEVEEALEYLRQVLDGKEPKFDDGVEKDRQELNRVLGRP